MYTFLEVINFKLFKIWVFEVKDKPYLMVTVFKKDQLISKLYCRPSTWLGRVAKVIAAA